MGQVDDVSVQVGVLLILLTAEYFTGKYLVFLRKGNLSVKEEKVDSEEKSSLSCFILAVSLLLVSENWLAITTRQRLIMKNVPILLRQ